MYISQVSNINFESDKKLYISKLTQENTKKLLKKMNNNTIYIENPQGTNFTSNILAGVSLGNKVHFSDNRFFIGPTEEQITNKADSTLYIGKKFLSFNSVSGEIFKYKKGFFSTLKSFLGDAEDYIDILTKNFDNPHIVTKKSFGIKGFTKKGLKILEEAQNKI